MVNTESRSHSMVNPLATEPYTNAAGARPTRPRLFINWRPLVTTNVKWLVLITALGFAVRILGLLVAVVDDGDSPTRIWMGWQWLSNPHWITAGTWVPLHTYLNAFALAIWPDPALTPALLHMIFSVATAIPLYLFTRNEFRSEKAALFVAAAFTFYPVAVRNSVMALADIPFAFFLAASLYFLSVARQPRGHWSHALAAGLLLTLGGMLRLEGWLLIPLLGLSLWKKPRLLVIFVAGSMLFPILWMIGSQMQYGDPLYSFHWTAAWNSVIDVPTEDLATGGIKHLLYYPLALFFGLTPLVASLSLFGAGRSILRRKPGAIWIIPFLAIFCFLVIQVMRGSLVMKGRYTITSGLLLLPFAAVVYSDLVNRIGPKAKQVLIQVLLVISIIPLSYIGNVVPSALVQEFFRSGINAIPRMDRADDVVSLAYSLDNDLNRTHETALITDFIGWDAMTYVALMTRLHPDHIFFAPGATNDELSTTSLAEFIEHNEHGIALLKNGSRFCTAIKFSKEGRATVENQMLRLEALDSSQAEDVTIYHYQLAHQRQSLLIRSPECHETL